MEDFYIRIRSFQDVQDLIELAMSVPFSVSLSNSHQRINATSFMGLVSLDHTRPLRVTANCGEALFREFREKAARFAAV